ncbi:methyltransferase FkbM family protein [Candidatus Termititenax aidoneus]|uniref:Methyltransferase FkbM family protein n=1 Tax=Termititenax aidoneus TaxID=2218524 RepID=A0A388TAK6_TERA1|nr:methyltransferase FkbM family protein [Candidatus Termititenax aidoneus]
MRVNRKWLAFFKKFKSDYDKMGLYENYKKLIRSLDVDSVATVSRVLSHVETVVHKNIGGYADIFTEKEKAEIKLLRKDFGSRIIKISNECFVYKKFFLPINWFEVCVFYNEYGLQKLKTLKSVKNKNIIDAGAFIGDSALVFRQYTNQKVYAFEPVTENYKKMLKTIELNDCADSVIPVQYALGSKKEKKRIYIGNSESSLHELHKKTPFKQSEEIEVITLDDYVREHNLKIGLIKTDLEGAEQDFLKGAENTIKKQKPVLMISIYHSAADFFKIKPMLESWDLGYTFSVRRETDGFALLETTLIAEVLTNK